MRYNQLFTVKTDITIPGDFTIKAGDLLNVIFLNYQEMKSKV